ncbi:MAG TPA: (2Fe-2S)-binding protein [Anaerolineaceae bacterium]|nr:(2Fe-2S)-binding protein [Anaerolineaceae bacterium]
MTTLSIQLNVNGRPVRLDCPPERSLLELLREDLGLTGAKDACGGEGECGACTVLLDGQAVNACLVLAVQADGHSITTIEGLTGSNGLHPIQQAFLDAGAVQCGFCTPGAVLATKALLDQHPQPTEEQIREGLAGNLCRCTGYATMLAAVRMAAEGLSHAQ